MSKKKAFTIIEILITMIIMGTLSSTLIPRIGDAKEKANETMTKVNQNRQYACELGLDDLCDSSAGSETINNSDGIHYVGTDITECREGNCITMMDRNLGASKSGTSCSSADTGACGNHYQWGNNYGFTNPGTNGGDTITTAATNILALWSTNYNHVGYNGTTFIKGTNTSKYDYWSDNTPSNHNGLRGGEDDSHSAGNMGFSNGNRGWNTNTNSSINPINRKGPCPAGYHVPSAGEWSKILEYWVQNQIKEGNNYTLNYSRGLSMADGQFLNFKNDFLIPFAGDRKVSDGKIENIDSYANLRSSSINGNNINVNYFRLTLNDAHTEQISNRAYGYSVRCFKN